MALTPAVQAWLLSVLGTNTNITDLETRYTRLGSARAVALEVLRQRLADLRAQPSTINVSTVVGISYVENIKSYERQIEALENGENPAPDDPTSPDGDSLGGIGLLYLRERPRR
ncbi:hypothetical protein [Streptomyces leeuwenhoekii]|uniref:Sle1_125 protein n=1 Tax=Streptomyces leeuwenhoekii TaxID=1437453 RepID=A0A0F7VPM7_STRLW|nr:hypothetical protein [Streptomyces leeuwenhoekii]CQR59292.1 sle1_125 [Streptomyces leeuwenhoekii]